MSCDFNCLDVQIYQKVKDFYEIPTTQEAIRAGRLTDILPHKKTMDLADCSTLEANLICLYLAILDYLVNKYSLMWSSIILWSPLVKNYEFRTIKRTDSISNKRFDLLHEFANNAWYKNEILSLTRLIFVEHNISRPLVLNKKAIVADDILQIDVSKISSLILSKLQDSLPNKDEEIIEVIQQLDQDAELIRLVNDLELPAEIGSFIRADTIKFLRYLIWLNWLEPSWQFYYYIPATNILVLEEKETGGQSLGVGTEIAEKDLNKLLIINSIIHEPISRVLNRKVSIEKETMVKQTTLNILEQTYHDMTNRYLPIFKREPSTLDTALLLENKMTYLSIFARDEKKSARKISISVYEVVKSLFDKLDYFNKTQFYMDPEALESLKFKISVLHPGAFESLFENMIGNTCKHAFIKSTGPIKISIAAECINEILTYSDDGAGYDREIEGDFILDRIEKWFKGEFSTQDVDKKVSTGTIRGMGLYIINQAANFLGWKIVPEIISDDGLKVKVKFSIIMRSK